MTDGAGGKDLRIDLEGHGREEIFEGIDLSRTLGWFTTIFPVRLKVDWSADLSEAIKSVKEQLRRVPDRGLSYGVLRYLTERDETINLLRKHPPAEILFNYLGQFDHVVAGSQLFKFASEPVECWHSSQGQRTYAMEVLSLILHGQLEIRWIYSENLHQAATIERLASAFLRALQALIAHCRTAGEGGRTPSDFPLARVPQRALDDIVKRYPGIEDLYPLSPMQQLFYSMETAAGALGFEQWRFSLRGPLDPGIVRWAWENVLALHPILRSAFISDGLDEPHQVVLRETPLPWTEHDWRHIPPPDREQRLRSFLDADLSAAFDLKTAPLMRIGLLRLTEEEWELIWSTHHLLIDGWSWPLVFKDLSRFYVAKCEGRAIDRSVACVYKEYIHWLLRDRPESESFWRQELLGFTAPTSLALTGTPASKEPTVEVAEISCRLSEEKTADLQRFSRSNQITLSTVVQGAWALLLSHYSEQDDVIFGAAFSGRPPEIPGIEGMVGPCVNNLPVRVRLSQSESVLDWLLKLQQQQFELNHHQYASLQQIQEWSEVPWRFRLFDSLLVFQNYLNDESTRKLSQEVAIRTIASPEATNYPLTLTVTPGPELNFKVLFQSSRFDGSAIEYLLRDLVNLTKAIPEGGARQLEEMLGFLPQESRGLAKRASENAFRHAVKTFPYSAPASDLEQKIADIWKDLFQIEQVGMDVNFFDLGGHSLLLLRAHERVRALIDDQLPVVALLKYPTIRSLARHLRKQESEDTAPRDFTDRARKQREALLRRRAVLVRDRERG
jgi:non-ribosomal peptide synthase protein (TIGR01720 family)